MELINLVVIVCIVSFKQAEAGFMSTIFGKSVAKGDKSSVLTAVQTSGFTLKDKATIKANWQLQGDYKSKNDYVHVVADRTIHSDYILQCYKGKANNKYKVVMFYSYGQVLEADVTSCDRNGVWNSFYLQNPSKGYHQITAVFKNKCVQYQINIETSMDSMTGSCPKNPGSTPWETI